MRYLLLVLLSLNLFAVDASLKIEKDVEHRSRIALEDASPSANEQFFKILLSDLKISGHFLADTKHHRGDLNSNFIAPALKSKEYVLRYVLTQGSGTKFIIRLLKASDGKELFKKSYAIPTTSKAPFLAHKAISDINDVLKYPSISWINRYVVFSRYTSAKQSEIMGRPKAEKSLLYLLCRHAPDTLQTEYLFRFQEEDHLFRRDACMF